MDERAPQFRSDEAAIGPARRSGWGLLKGEIALLDDWDSCATNEEIARDFEQ